MVTSSSSPSIGRTGDHFCAGAEATVRGLHMPLDDGIRMETLVANLLAGTADLQEGGRAFVEKRIPKFGGHCSGGSMQLGNQFGVPRFVHVAP